jgi:hypothetical protein
MEYLAKRRFKTRLNVKIHIKIKKTLKQGSLLPSIFWD